MQVAREAGVTLLLATALTVSLLGGGQSVPAQTPAQPGAQEPAAPALTPADQQLLALWESRLESASLRVALAQAQMELLRRDAEGAITALQREGYTLRRGDDGGWSYVKAPPR